MHEDQFLYGGLRLRLERMGQVRPKTTTLESVAQQPETPHTEAASRPAQRSRQPRLRALQPAHHA